MAAYDFSKPDPDEGHFIWEPGPGPCFLCGAAIHGIAVYWWNGSGQNALFLHETCARDLGCHLISDAIDAKKMRAKQWRPVVLSRGNAA